MGRGRSRSRSRSPRRRASRSRSRGRRGSAGPGGLDPGSRQARRLVKAAKRYLKEHLKKSSGGGSGGGAAARPAWPPPDNPLPAPDAVVPTLSPEDDYFLRAPEFKLWLTAALGASFSDLASDAARRHFASFASAWNARTLPARFYDGSAVAASSNRGAAAAWGFAARAPDRRDRAADLEELLPRATGRDAAQEKRAGRREAAAARGGSPDMAPGEAFGSGPSDSFAAAAAREAARTRARDARLDVKRAALSAKAAEAKAVEDARMAAFRSLAAAGPITIAKRAPPPPE